MVLYDVVVYSMDLYDDVVYSLDLYGIFFYRLFVYILHLSITIRKIAAYPIFTTV